MGKLILDDRDPAISYSPGHWRHEGMHLEYQHTTSATSVEGASATITFYGTGITVLGTLGQSSDPRNAPVSTYELDSNSLSAVPPRTFSGRLLPDRVQYHVKFYEVTRLPYGRHTLVITNESGSGTVWLDEIHVLGAKAVPDFELSTFLLGDHTSTSGSGGAEGRMKEIGRFAAYRSMELMIFWAFILVLLITVLARKAKSIRERLRRTREWDYEANQDLQGDTGGSHCPVY
ncbi:hypothetical protein CC2G_008179 [Coprinopsis cinerea AmutBmut pab1-1]|nr:hypothetical protein CC2G_008179 [Coprinopsis cinerea AmutBmut pab1-1]